METSEPGRSSLNLYGRKLTIGEYLNLIRACFGRVGTRPLFEVASHGLQPLAAAEVLQTPMEIHERRRQRDEKARELRAAAAEARSRVDTILANRYDHAAAFRGWPDRSGWGVPEEEEQVPEFDPRNDVNNLISHAESEGIAVTWGTYPESLGGFVARPDTRRSITRDMPTAPRHIDTSELQRVAFPEVVITLNIGQSWASCFEVLVHELAHVLLGHVGAMRGARAGRLCIVSGQPLSLAAVEFEAHSTTMMVARARWVDSPLSLLSMLKYHTELANEQMLELVDVIEMFVAAEVLCAWCASGPDRSTARGWGGGRPSGELVG